MSRVACALCTIKPVLDKYDEDNHAAKTSGTHQEAESLEDLKAVINRLNSKNIFERHKRVYSAF